MKISSEILAKIKELEIHTRKILSGSTIGVSRTRQKGFGFEFDQLRAYQFGDDVRLIDWKSSARSNNLLVRQYYEDRNRTILICVDVSASMYFGSSAMLKSEVAQQVAGILALVGAWSGDKVGLVLFSDHIEKTLYPVKGHKHVHQLLQELYMHRSVGKKTNYDVLADHIARYFSKHAMIFLISDFLNNQIFDSIKKFNAGKDIVAVVCADEQEQHIKNTGYVWMQDPETDELALISTRGFAQSYINKALSIRRQEQQSLWFKSRVDAIYLSGTHTLMHDLIAFFQNRMM